MNLWEYGNVKFRTGSGLERQGWYLSGLCKGHVCMFRWLSVGVARPLRNLIRTRIVGMPSQSPGSLVRLTHIASFFKAQ